MRYNEDDYLKAFPRDEAKPTKVESAVVHFPEEKKQSEEMTEDVSIETVVEPEAQEGVPDAGSGDLESDS